ncbi:hypothetical protein [Streptomyces sp. NPDC058613]|uniref:hypothetical protein n=1 Tax=unclassified Streptomyces TaxID=2593676 RepID=UPI0036468159
MAEQPERQAESGVVESALTCAGVLFTGGLDAVLADVRGSVDATRRVLEQPVQALRRG